MPFTPRPFQTEFCGQSVTHWQTRDKLLCALGTGAGKTKMTSHLFTSYITSGVVWVLCHESPLVLQWLEAFEGVGVDSSEVSIVATKFPVPKDAAGNPSKDCPEARANKRLGLNFNSRFIICMVKQVEKSLAQADLLGLMPDYLVIDEGHLVLNHQGCRKLRVAAWKHNQSFKTLVLTASPKAHGALVVHPEDYVDRRDWLAPISNKELINQGFWSHPEYVDLPESYIEKARKAFKGLKVGDDGEVSGTSQSAVMMAMMPDHVEMIAELPRRSGETFMVYCATVAQAKAMAVELTVATGENWLAVDGSMSNAYKSDALEALRSGVLPEMFDRTGQEHLIEGNSFRGVTLVNMWQAGTDAPRASTCVIACVMMSFPRFYQGAGRIVRLFEGLTARYLDLGLNFIGKHPLMEDVDFMGDFEASDLKFADAHTLMCQNPACLYVHKRIPTPKHPHGKILGQPWSHQGDTIDACTGKIIKAPKGPTLKIDLMTGIFSDGIAADIHEPLCCVECGAPVMGDPAVIETYMEWKRNPESEKPKRMGITIGLGGSEHMTLATMWEYGLWQKLEEDSQGLLLDEEKEPGEVKDNSESWEQRRDRVRVFRQSEAARRARTKTLSPSHQRVASVEAKVLQAESKVSPDKLRGSLRRAMLKAYVDSQSPLDTLSIIIGYGSLKNIPGLSGSQTQRENDLLIEAFEQTYSKVQAETPSRSDCYREFEEWITHYLDEADQMLRLSPVGSVQYKVYDRKIEQLSPLLDCIRTYELSMAA